MSDAIDKERIKGSGTGCLGSLLVIGPLAVLFIIISVWAWFSYNRMVSKEELVNAQWGQVENTYQRRADLIDNLTATVKGYMSHEQKTLIAVTEARAGVNSININADNLDESAIQQFETMQQNLSSAFSRLLVTVEKYPDLKADQSFLKLQSQLEEIENTILIQRNQYNDVAREYNTYIRKFPNNVFASLFGFSPRAYFKSFEGADKVPKVNFE